MNIAEADKADTTALSFFVCLFVFFCDTEVGTYFNSKAIIPAILGHR